MTFAPKHAALPAAPSVDDSPAVDLTALLPAREVVLARLAEQLAATDGTLAASLLVIGLLRRDDGRPTPATTVAQVTSLIARSLRGEDWLGTSGPAEFVIVMSGSAIGAHTAAHRLATAIGEVGVPGLAAAAGIAQLAPDITAREALRRAMLSLTAARRVGPGGVVQLRDPA